MDSDAFKQQMSSINMGEVMAAAAKDYQKVTNILAYDTDVHVFSYNVLSSRNFWSKRKRMQCFISPPGLNLISTV